jgi:hypothetical protein
MHELMVIFVFDVTTTSISISKPTNQGKFSYLAEPLREILNPIHMPRVAEPSCTIAGGTALSYICMIQCLSEPTCMMYPQQIATLGASTLANAS